jgi:putative endonuclease
MAKHLKFGRKGEQLAKAFLEKGGYEILEENWTHKKSEIDLIAYKEGKIIFVEVKTRSSNSYGDPEDFVIIPKQQQMTYGADEYIYLMSHKGEVRFDVIAILFDASGKHVLNHIEDAFWP